MEKLKEVLTSKIARRFYWQTAGGFLGLAVIYFQGLNWLYAPVVIAIIQSITKELNNRYSSME